MVSVWSGCWDLWSVAWSSCDGRRFLTALRSKNRQRREAARRAAENMPNQGMAAEIIKLTMIRVHARLREEGMASRMLLQVHD